MGRLNMRFNIKELKTMMPEASNLEGMLSELEADIVKLKDEIGDDSKYAGMHNILDEQRHDQDIVASIRPEELIIDPEATEGLKATIDDSVFLGLNTHYMVHLEDGTKLEIIQESKIDSIIPKGTEIHLIVNSEKVNLFTADGSKNILTGVRNDGDLYTKGHQG